MPQDTQREIFLDLLDCHGAKILATLRRLCGNAHDADDLFQETTVLVIGAAKSPDWFFNEMLNPFASRTFAALKGRKRSPGLDLISRAGSVTLGWAR